MDNITVLITGIGAPGVYGIIKGLKQNGERDVRLIGVDIDPDIASRYFVDQFCFVPPRTSPEFIPAITEIAQKEGVDLIFPVPTTELELFSTAKPQLEAQVKRVLVSDIAGLAIANNKQKLYDHLSEKGFDCVPEYRVANDYDSFLAAVKDLGYPRVPVCMKKPVSMGAQGFRILDENADRVELLLQRFPDSTITDLESIKSILSSAEPFPKLLVQEYLPGPEYDVDVLARDGDVLISLPRKNEKMLWGMSLVSRAEKHDELIALTAQVIRELGLSYVISPSFRFARDGRPKIIEINPRVPGSIVAAIGAGANLPYLSVKMALGENFTLPEIRWRTKMIRYWEELIIEG